jgi:hypothetical protein
MRQAATPAPPIPKQMPCLPITPAGMPDGALAMPALAAPGARRGWSDFYFGARLCVLPYIGTHDSSPRVTDA